MLGVKGTAGDGTCAHALQNVFEIVSQLRLAIHRALLLTRQGQLPSATSCSPDCYLTVPPPNIYSGKTFGGLLKTFLDDCPVQTIAALMC